MNKEGGGDKTASPFLTRMIKIWPKNFMTYYKNLQAGYLYGVGITDQGQVACELKASGGKLRLGVLYCPQTNTIVHSCPSAQTGKPCWHLAAVMDAASVAQALTKPLVIPPKGPVTVVNVENRFINAGLLTIKEDLTGDYLIQKNYPPRPGDFKVFLLQESPGYLEVSKTPTQKGSILSNITNIFKKVANALS